MSNRSETTRNGPPEVDEEDRRTFLRILGVTGAVGAANGFTLDEVKKALGVGSTGELATVGGAIRSDLTGRLDESLLRTQLANVEAEIDRLSELRAAGIPSAQGTAFHEVAAPAWTVYDHLAEVGFFESAEVNLPGFTPEHIESTAKELIRSRPLTEALSAIGLSEREKTAIVMNVVNNDERLSFWLPTDQIPTDVEEFDPRNVAPLHQRATGGALLWIDELDRHLWQRAVLITDEMFDRGMWDVKSMLAGFHLVTAAVHDVAGPADLTDSQLTAALTSGAALTIIGQEDVAADLFRVSDEMRVPRGGV